MWHVKSFFRFFFKKFRMRQYFYNLLKYFIFLTMLDGLVKSPNPVTPAGLVPDYIR